MKVMYKGFLNGDHSWSINLNIARKMKELGHEVHLCSTNGHTYFPEDLKENIKCINCENDNTRNEKYCSLDKDYDLSISYTACFHWKDYLSRGKVKFGIYNIDGSLLPVGFAKNHLYVDKILPTSNTSKETFLKAGVPKEKLVVVPHCYRDEYITRTNTINLPTDRKVKILVNLQQGHRRKNIPGLLESFGKAFTDKDDVVMIAKVKIKKPESPFEVYFPDELKKFKAKYPNHAPIIVFEDFVDYISDLYRSVDIVFSASNVEAFLLPALEGIVSKKIVIATGGEVCAGNVDYMKHNVNSLLIKATKARLPENFQYWAAQKMSAMMQPDTDHAAELLRYAVSNYNELKQKFDPGMNEVIKNYSSAAVTNQILDLYKSCSNQ
jgi:glycosyltransferase involved in cell wall biosynthesis